MTNSKKSVEQVFSEVVTTLTGEQQEALIGILHSINSQNIAAEMAVTPKAAAPAPGGADETQLDMMQRYIDRTPIPNQSNYQLRQAETCALYDLAQHDRVGALFMAFEYGLSKGYRAAQAAVKNLKKPQGCYQQL